MPDAHNPHYDEPGVLYDSGFFYADGVPDVPATPTHRNRKAMASISANLSRKNAKQLIELADLVAPKLAPTPPATPPIPNMGPKVTALTAKRDLAKAASDEYEAAKVALAALKAKRDATADDLRQEHESVISACESEAKGDPVMLAATGYALASPKVQNTSPPAQILNVTVTAGDNDGSVDVSFDPDGAANTYEVQVTTVDPIAGPWVTKAQPTASGATLDALTSGQRVWVRVRGIGSKGAGPWSDPATKIVP